MNSINDCFTLNDGHRLPCMGYGTYKVTGQDNLEILKNAIACGYRLFDTATLYETERILGKAIKESGLPRENFIIGSKLWYDEKGYDKAKETVLSSLKRLQIDYLDYYLIHWPRSTGAPDEDWKAVNRETWRALEDLQAEGKIRSIGCSNFLPHHLEALMKDCRVKPAIDQLELHPGYTQEATVRYCQDHGIQLMAWAPLARGNAARLFDNPALQALAAKYQKSIPQISLRFLHQKGIIPIPKAASEKHMLNNMDIFSFSLTEEEVWMLSCMPQTTWDGEHPDFAIPKVASNPNQ